MDMKLLVFGSCNIDRTYSVGHFVGAGETLAAETVEEFVGGKGLNQAIALARAGGEVDFAGAVGADGGMLCSALDACGVNTEHLKRTQGLSGHAIIQIDPSGENCILLFGGANREIDRSFVSEVLSGYGEGDAILLQNEISLLDFIVREAKNRGMRVYLNPSPFDKSITTLDMKDIHTLILNRVELSMLCESEGIECTDTDSATEKIISRYPHLHLVLTLGGDGCIYRDEKEYCSHPIYKVDVTDTTGAGDTFTGYFITSIERGESAQRAIKLACAAAALSVTEKGASSSIPEYGRVIEFLAERGEKI